MSKIDLHLAYKQDSGRDREKAIVNDIQSIVEIINEDYLKMEEGYENHVALDPEYLEWLEEKVEGCLTGNK
jgi:hypothetical protein